MNRQFTLSSHRERGHEVRDELLGQSSAEFGEPWNPELFAFLAMCPVVTDQLNAKLHTKHNTPIRFQGRIIERPNIRNRRRRETAVLYSGHASVKLCCS